MRAGIRTRWHAGRGHALRMLAAEPWAGDFDPLQGIAVHEMSERGADALTRSPVGFRG